MMKLSILFDTGFFPNSPSLVGDRDNVLNQPLDVGIVLVNPVMYLSKLSAGFQGTISLLTSL